MAITDIIKGHVKEVLNQGQELSKSRMDICKACPLLKESKLGPICNPALHLNPETNTTVEVKTEGYIRGCGCRLNAKTRLDDAKCPAGKW